MGTFQTPDLKRERIIHQLGQWSGIALFSFMTFRQVYYFYPGTEDLFLLIKWGLVTVLFLQFLLAYFSRTQAKVRANHILDVVLPFTCAGLPFFIIMVPRWINPYITSDEHIQLWNFWNKLFYDPLKVTGLSLMAFGEVITILGMLGLRGSFSIATEVRVLRTEGPYKWVRHPLYTGEIISISAWTLYWCNLFGLCGTLLFIILQCWRAKREEAKLSQVYPEYLEYKKKVGFLFPKLTQHSAQ